MDNDYQFFIDKVKKKTRIDLSQYKEKQMKRRLTSLSVKNGFSSLKSFYEQMEKDKALMDKFLSHMTINVSEFYRNRRQWDILAKDILPSMTENQKNIKIWSAACSTGEEPYSLATLLHPYKKSIAVSLMATDIDSMVLEQAKLGLYSEKSLKELRKEEVDRYFINSGSSYQIDSKYKQMVSFKKHDLLEGTYGTDFDLIVCRNVLIYFTEEAKEKVFRKFSDSLRKGGILFLGTTERINNPQQYGLKPIQSFFFEKV
ncbi:CheR family methyltransferase [Sediminibacillus massiliensis]|uniref:CheR family methyltransferase n=1 Tax=Sediminibacillus massiliensis TaxID=1926277 RepID=UPI0009884715|nr:protein-glutamate O-methyltransferase CheR [Sediminibacillus massiliensis]